MLSLDGEAVMVGGGGLVGVVVEKGAADVHASHFAQGQSAVQRLAISVMKAQKLRKVDLVFRGQFRQRLLALGRLKGDLRLGHG